ncbi:hypothetical protein TrLO_g9464 [Triparma laevis f. longispina]|uniref:Spore protein YkvP/CgeB glycosyl transferase-like domain-containing protein n=1 Tax=Triparma laevis f. longispina TaxID=1714387 RepID=A0A9W7AYE3_9STRA|nr:hypothetical protein TrLO_g9464 [Triparma laevis f. longispina]
MLPPLLLLLLLLLYFPPTTSPPPPLQIALHSQSQFSTHGWVSGSEITTLGLGTSLSKFKNVNVTYLSTFNYGGLPEGGVDFLIVEGYIGTLPRLISHLRHKNPNLIVTHWCLDTFPTFPSILSLDVNFFLTNSEYLSDDILPTYGFNSYFLELASSTTQFNPNLKSEEYEHIDVVYVGQYAPTKTNLIPLLHETKTYCKQHNLAFKIYGNTWSLPSISSEIGSLIENYAGILPLNDLGKLYASVKVVLGSTEIKQEELGMVNNRVYEVLASGAHLLIPLFEPLRPLQDFGVSFYTTPGDVEKILNSLIKIQNIQAGGNVKGRKLILEKHSWDIRASEIMRIYEREKLMIEGNKKLIRARIHFHSVNSNLTTGFTEIPNRPRRPSVFFVCDQLSDSCNTYTNKFSPLHESGKLNFYAVSFSELGSTTFSFNTEVDLLLILTSINSDLELIARNMTLPRSSRKGIIITNPPTYPSIKLSDYYDLLTFDNFSPDLRLYTHPNIIKHISLLDMSELEYAVLFGTLQYPKSRSAIYIKTVEPTNEGIQVGIKIEDMVPPNDGVWCLWVEEVLVRCLGDFEDQAKNFFPEEIIAKVEVTHSELNEKGVDIRGRKEFEIRVTINAGDLQFSGVANSSSVRAVYDGFYDKGGDEM